MKRAAVVLAIPFLILAAGLLGAAWGYRSYAPRHPDQSHAVRLRAIESQAAQVGNIDTLIVGDSLVELAHAPELCGASVLNAGVGGGRIADAAAVLSTVAGKVKPKRIVLAVGVNEAARGAMLSPDEFERRYDDLIFSAAASGGAVVAATIAPVAKDGPLGASYFSRHRIEAFNTRVRRLAAVRGIKVVDLAHTMAGADGFLPAPSSIDGAHLSPAGYVQWKSAISSAC